MKSEALMTKRTMLKGLGALAGAALLQVAPQAVSDAFMTRRVLSTSLTFGAGLGVIDSDFLLNRVTLEI